MFNNTTVTLIDLYLHYPMTYRSFSDLYTYEVIILLIYGVMIIFSFFTNLIALIIFSFGRLSRSELSPFLFNLSVFNIIMTVYCIPFTITTVIFQRWIYARELCIVLDVFKTFSVSGVLLTLITIAIDRYCAVKYPLAMKVYSVHKRNIIALLIIWILSIALAIIWSPARSLPVQQKRLWVSSRAIFHEYIGSIDNITDIGKFDYFLKDLHFQLVDTIQCVPNKNGRPVEVKLSILNFLQTYFFPLFILAFVYLRIAAMLWHRSNDHRSNENGTIRANGSFTHESIQFKKKLKQGIKTLVAVVVLYAILWLPMNVFQLCLNLLCFEGTQYQDFCTDSTLLQLLYIACHFLTVSNTAINPIIYGFMNSRFRSDIQQIKYQLLHCEGGLPLCCPRKYQRASLHELEARRRESRIRQNSSPMTRNLTGPRKYSSPEPRPSRTTITTFREPANIIIQHAT